MQLEKREPRIKSFSKKLWIVDYELWKGQNGDEWGW
jgi:hypothetical protein